MTQDRFSFHKRRGISWRAKWLLASQDGLSPAHHVTQKATWT